MWMCTRTDTQKKNPHRIAHQTFGQYCPWRLNHSYVFFLTIVKSSDGGEQLLLKCQQLSFDNHKNTDYLSIPIEYRITRSHQRSEEIRLYFTFICEKYSFDFVLLLILMIRYYWELLRIYTTLYIVSSDWMRFWTLHVSFLRILYIESNVMFWGIDANWLY